MIAFLPIARYRVQYQIASGRPFSSFEKLLLKAVKSGHNNVADLANIFAVHRRLVIEGLVTLMQAGWVSIGTGETEFILSQSGLEASEADGLPPTIAVADRGITVIVEKVTGQVARSNEVDFQPRRNLTSLWDKGITLKKGDVSNVIDPALIAPLIPHRPTEWVRWIGPITVLSDNAAFSVIDVDTKSKRITGVPKNWETLLLTDCLDQVIRQERKIIESGVRIDDQELRKFVRRDLPEAPEEDASDVELAWSPSQIQSEDVFWSSAQHRSALVSLAGRAVTYFAIACPELSESGLTELIPLLESALARGLLINIFLGRMPKREDRVSWSAFDTLKKIEHDSGQGKHSGRLVLGTSETECSTSIAFADVLDGASVILGSYAWTAPLSSDPLYLSVQFGDPWIVARVCEILAGFSSADERLRLGAGFVRLKKAAGSLRQKVQMEPSQFKTGEFEARLLLDKDQQPVIQSVMSDAQESLTVLTDDLVGLSTSDWANFLLEAVERLGSRVCIVHYTNDQNNIGSIPMMESMLKNGVSVKEGAPLIATIIIADNRYVVVTSSRVSSTSARQSYIARIGIAIKGSSVANKLFEVGGKK